LRAGEIVLIALLVGVAVTLLSWTADAPIPVALLAGGGGFAISTALLIKLWQFLMDDR
jgi:hypothetical protein